ncbi:MAG: beta-galactosidase [Thermodesulfobacteriota bacterium]
MPTISSLPRGRRGGIPSCPPRRRAIAARWLSALCLALLLAATPCRAGLAIKEGYFWDEARKEHFIPHGFAYQVWNPAVFANQSVEEVDRDLAAMKAAGANSLRVELVWSELEQAEGRYDWNRADQLIRRAEALGLRLFVLVGYQYAPGWLLKSQPEVAGRTAEGTASPVLNYSHPKAREAYSRYIAAVCGRYRDSAAIGGWILGNEMAFYDLWDKEEQKRFIGFDAAYSLPSYRAFLAKRYRGDIRLLNAAWDTGFASFDQVAMATRYPADRNDHAALRRSGYNDLIAWRKEVIADFVAAGAVAARKAAPGQLRSYSMLAGMLTALDSCHPAEDARLIAERCRQAGAPLDFLSLNNYAWALSGHELRSMDFGIGRFRDLVGLPVLITETGHSSTETLFPGGPRQGAAVVGSAWEAMLSGAMGVHIFHWQDRDGFLGGNFSREAGFGVVDSKRRPKPGVYEEVVAMFGQMEALPLKKLLPGSRLPEAEVAIPWPEEIELGGMRAVAEVAGLWGGLRRIGIRPRLLDGRDFDRLLQSGKPPAVKAVLLARHFQMRPEQLAGLKGLLARGVHLHANGDLPGQFDGQHVPNPAWRQAMAELFGVKAENSTVAFESGSVPLGDWQRYYTQVRPQRLATATLPITDAMLHPLATWKLQQGTAAGPGATAQLATESGMPLLITASRGNARSALTTFALGDIVPPWLPAPPTLIWDIHSGWLKALYHDLFRIQPWILLSGPGSGWVMPELRLGKDSALLALHNQHDQPAELSLQTPLLAQAKAVRDLLTGQNLAATDGRLTGIRLGPDQYRLFMLSL